MTDLKKLTVWQKAHLLALATHRMAGKIRAADAASMRSQMTRAALSVPANIVEGSGQKSAREFSRFLRIALNSTTELEYHLIAARDLGVLRPEDCLNLPSQVIEVRKMLYGFLRHLAARAETESKSHKAPTPPA